MECATWPRMAVLLWMLHVTQAAIPRVAVIGWAWNALDIYSDCVRRCTAMPFDIISLYFIAWSISHSNWFFVNVSLPHDISTPSMLHWYADLLRCWHQRWLCSSLSAKLVRRRGWDCCLRGTAGAWWNWTTIFQGFSCQHVNKYSNQDLAKSPKQMPSFECPDHTDGMRHAPVCSQICKTQTLYPILGILTPSNFECRPPTNLAEELSQEPLQIWPLMSVAPPFIPRTSMCLAPRRGQFPLSRCAAEWF